MQVHELLEAVEDQIGCALYEERPQETLEVLNSIVRVLHAISVRKPFVKIAQGRSSFVIAQLSDITQVIVPTLVGEPTASPVIRRRCFSGLDS